MTTPHTVLVASCLCLASCTAQGGSGPAYDAGPTRAGDAEAPEDDAAPARDATPAPDAGTATEACDDGLDGDADGTVDEGCSCTPGHTQPCYPAASPPIGACEYGTQTCTDDGGEFGGWGACEGAVRPAEEVCGDGIDQDCDGEDAACPDPGVACETHPHDTRDVTLHFPKPDGCDWTRHVGSGWGGRLEQREPIDLPEGAILCGMDVEVPQTDMYFDDHVLIAFDDVVLMSSVDPAPYFDVMDGMYRYDWDAAVGRPFEPSTYCFEADRCELPGTEENGSIELVLPDETVHRLAEVAIAEGRYELMVVTAGDDNPDVDCRHTAFDVELSLRYVIP